MSKVEIVDQPFDRMECPFLGPLDEIGGQSHFKLTAEATMIRKMLAEGIEHARASFMGEEILIKLITLGSAPELNAIRRWDLDKGRWRLLETVKDEILHMKDPQRWFKERARKIFGSMPFSAPTTNKPRKSGGAEREENQHPLLDILNNIQRQRISTKVEENESRLEITESPLNTSTTNLINNFHSLFRRLARSARAPQLSIYELHGYYEYITLLNLEPALRKLNILPRNPRINHLDVEVIIDCDPKTGKLKKLTLAFAESR